MEDIYDTMYSSDESSDGAFGLAGLQSYMSMTSKEAQGIIDNINKARFLVVDEENKRTWHDKYQFTEDTTLSEIFGHKIPNYVLTDNYSKHITDEILDFHPTAFDTITQKNPKGKEVSYNNFRSSLWKDKHDGNTLVKVESIKDGTITELPWNKAQALIS